MKFHGMLAWKWARGQIKSEGEKVELNECNKLLSHMYSIWRVTLCQNAKIVSSHFICHLQHESLSFRCCLLLLPHLRWLIDSMAFSMNRIISRCQDMNRLETQNWINAQRKSVGTMRIKRVRGRNEIDDDVDDGDSEHFEKIIYTPANRCIICLEYGMRWDQTRWNDSGNMLAKRNWSYHWEGIWHDDEEEQQKPQQHQNRQCKRNDEENATKCVHWTRTTERLKANSKQKVKTRYRNKKE